jgi:hypothetical protein
MLLLTRRRIVTPRRSTPPPPRKRYGEASPELVAGSARRAAAGNAQASRSMHLAISVLLEAATEAVRGARDLFS